MKKSYTIEQFIADNHQHTVFLSIPPMQKGIYILILYVNTTEKIQIGKLGSFHLSKGYYAYVGSAFGPGGLTARLKHHLKIADKPHWHIDYFRKRATVKEVWISECEKQFEHLWFGVLKNVEDALIPIPGFGSSDCQCEAHLIYFKKKPRFDKFQAIFHKHLDT